MRKRRFSGVYLIATWVGKRLSLHCTAIGKAMTAYLPEDTLVNLLSQQGTLSVRAKPVRAKPVRAKPVRAKRLKQNFARVRQRGYALDDEQGQIGIGYIGASLLGDSHGVGVLRLVGATHATDGNRLDALALYLRGRRSLVYTRCPTTTRQRHR